MIQIHYIEDNPVDQHAFLREIEKQSLAYKTTISSSLKEARMNSSVYDLILCDFFLPDGTILDIISDLVKDGTPVIVITGQADMSNAIAAMKRGARDYLVKDMKHQYLKMLPIQIENLLNNRKTEQERSWLSTIFYSVAETISFGMYLYEPVSDRVVYYNSAFLSIWDIPEGMYNSDKPLTHSEFWQKVTSRGGYEPSDLSICPIGQSDNPCFHPNGEITVRENKTIRFVTRRVLYEPGISPCYVSFFEDITELSRARESLYQYSQELESMNATLDQRVQERTLQVELLMKKKNEMMINIGHDLRTPLTPLIAILPHLRDQESDPEKLRLLSMLCEGAAKLHSLTEAALKIAHLGMGLPLFEGSSHDCLCNLREYMLTQTNRYLTDITNKDLSVVNDTPDDITFFFKPTQLRLILDNLIHNAIQYSNIGGTISLHGGFDGDSIWFCISDTGVGLKPNDASRIFDDFYKVDSARKNLYTHGVGLSVVKKLVILNNGHITVTSDGPGKGSRFCVSLPDCTRNG
ncbi:MAG TPA: hybrid sensor histidine kinase/response regulator [Methanospirillum sp.]|nr:hybrid sensor histidine kinase/response regulator [Methanospirillum sp.]